MTANLVTGFSPMGDLKSNVRTAKSDSAQTDFSEIFKAGTAAKESPPTKSGTSDLADKKSDVKATDSKDAYEKSKAAKGTEVVKKEKSGSVDETEAPKESDVLTEEELAVVIETVQTMLLKTAEVLQTDVEAVVEAMDNLGLESIEILDSGKIPQVVVELTDTKDVMELMVDEGLSGDVKGLMETSDNMLVELSKELDVPLDELKETIQTEVSKLKAEDNKEISREPVLENLKADENTRAFNINDAGNAESKRNDSGSKKESQGNAFNFAQTITDNIKAGLESIKEAEETFQSDVRAVSDIMEQVTESLKVNMTEDITEMEMQLHPASLGNIRVQVAARNGVITANFTAQNEQVRQALETQVVALKEQMNEQGIKVETIEVTVSSHAFERNLSQGEDRNQSRESEAKVKRPRRINLNDVNADLEEIEENDALTADMMARDGNTVDYLA